MFLHIATDEKFIDYAIEAFSFWGLTEQVFLVNARVDHPVKYIKNPGIVCLPYEREKYLEYVAEAKVVIFHNLIDEYKLDLLEAIPESVRIHWISWGGDIYWHPRFSKNPLMRETRKQLLLKFGLTGRVSYRLREKAPFLMEKIFPSMPERTNRYAKFNGLIRKIYSVSTVIPEEFDFVKKYLNKDIKYLAFNYGCVEDFLSGFLDQRVAGDNMLIGNSASLANNHLDIFNLLLNHDWTRCGNKLVPLSYGDQAYAKVVKERGRKYWGEMMISPEVFLSRDEWNAELVKCKYCIIGTKRQQAMGNIIACIYLGANVFLHKENLAFHSLRSRGIELYELSDLPYATKKSIEKNRKLIFNLYSKEAMLDKTKYLVTSLL